MTTHIQTKRRCVRCAAVEVLVAKLRFGLVDEMQGQAKVTLRRNNEAQPVAVSQARDAVTIQYGFTTATRNDQPEEWVCHLI